MAGWQPLYPHAKYIGPIRDNLEGLIKAREAEALNWANDGADMPVTKVWQKVIWYNTLNPFMAIVDRTTQKRGLGDEVLPQTHAIEIHIQDEGSSPDAVATIIETRVRAVDMIITTADPNVLKAGLDAQHIAITNLWVTSHSYSDVALNEKSYYVQAASLMVNIQTMES